MCSDNFCSVQRKANATICYATGTITRPKNKGSENYENILYDLIKHCSPVRIYYT